MELVFVYNADAGKINAALDLMHKLVSPATYACDLCALTYGNFGIRKEWEAFVKKLPVETRFLHKDEFLNLYPEITTKFPVLFILEGERLEQGISSEEMKILDLNGLIMRVTEIIRFNE